MSDDFKDFMRQYYSKMQHWRLMKIIEHWTNFLRSWEKLK